MAIAAFSVVGLVTDGFGGSFLALVPTGSLDWLHVDGKWIVNENGDNIALRGGGGCYTAYADSLGSDRWEHFETFLQEVKSIGGNCYRLAFNPVHRDGDTWDLKMTELDFEMMDHAIGLCEKYGIYAVLTCMHWQGDYWQLIPKYKDYWIETWVSVADRYKDVSSVAGYELCNEAWSYAEMAVECMNAIKQVDNNHMFFVIESLNTPYTLRRVDAGLSGTHTWNPNQMQPNVVYTFHHWWGYPRLSNPYSATDFEMGYVAASMFVETIRDYRELYNVPVLAGEFGTYDYNMDSADSEHVREIIRLCEEQKIGWWYWMMEKQVRDNGLSLYSMVRQTFFTSNYFGTNIPAFNPKPFTLENNIVSYGSRARDVSYCWWSSTYHAIAGPDAWIELKGPCKVRVRTWEGGFWYGTLVSEEIININSGETTKIVFNGYKEVFAFDGDYVPQEPPEIPDDTPDEQPPDDDLPDELPPDEELPEDSPTTDGFSDTQFMYMGILTTLGAYVYWDKKKK